MRLNISVLLLLSATLNPFAVTTTNADDLDMPAHLTRIRVGLGWTFPDDGDKLDLDVSCIMLRYFMK